MAEALCYEVKGLNPLLRRIFFTRMLETVRSYRGGSQSPPFYLNQLKTTCLIFGYYLKQARCRDI